MKKILYGNEARKIIKQGIDKCVDVVKVSMGGNGNNVLIYNGASTEIINDGVSIAHQVEVKDKTEQAGIQLAKQCANQTNEDAGDGTTTTLVLLQAILNQTITEFEAENPRELRERLFKEANEVLNNVKVHEVKTNEDVYNLALTSSLDSKVARIIADIYKELGKGSQISIEETSRDVLEKEIVGGIKFDSRNADKFVEDKLVFDECSVLVIDKVNVSEDIVEGVQKAIREGSKNLVIIANSFSRSVLLSIARTEQINIVPIEYKMFNTIEDIKDYAGDKCEQIIITNETTTLIGGNGDVENRIKTLKEKLEKEESQYEKECLENRIAQLQGKIAVIRVGKNTDVERQELVLKVEDAIGSVKGAYEMGYCYGGGIALINSISRANVSEMMKVICRAPNIQINKNSGVEFNKVGDEVIDSFKTVKYSLLNALSTATSIMTAEAVLIEEDDE